MTHPRSPRLVLAAIIVAAVTTTTLATAPVAAADSGHHGTRSHHDRTTIASTTGALTDTQLGVASPFDGADASVIMIAQRRSSSFGLFVTGVDSSAVGQTYGVHLHVGPCVEGDGAAAGPHYNRDVIAGDPDPVISNRTEVWLDVTIRAGGWGASATTVPFVPEPGTRAIMVHSKPTAPDGMAGDRIACRPFVITG